MKNPDSDYIFPIESENEDDEDKDFNGDEDDGKDYDLPEYADDDPHPQSKPDSLGPSWPQSYRKSMDLYGSITSPTLHFLGSPSLSSLGGSFLSSSPKRRRPTTRSLGSPLLPSGADNQQPEEHHSSDHSIQSQRVSSTKKLSHLKSHQTRQSSFGQAVVNGVNLLCGVGILSIPYAVKEGGWVGLSILFIFCVLSFYTGILLRCCLDSQPGLKTYPDIGEVAYGKAGRLVISIVLYVELYAACVEYIISESDNLSSLFPNAHLSLGGYQLSSHYLFAIMVTLLVLPTVWLRDMRVLSYISAGGVFVMFLLVICLYWIGLVDNIGFHTESTTTLNLPTLPVAIGLYGVCYAGHAVLPNIYMSMDKQNQYPLVLLASFGICSFLYAGVAIMGYMMFGNQQNHSSLSTCPQICLPPKLMSGRRYALTISPVAMSLEELIPSNRMKSHAYSILIRTVLVISTLLVALSIPFFGLLMSLIGSLLTMLVSLIFPCLCFLRILKGNITRFQGSLCILIIHIHI